MPELLTESVGLHFRPSETKSFVNNEMTADMPCTLEREPDNKYDVNAIKIHCEGHFIGYVPKVSNSVLAALMDQDAVPGLRAKVFSTFNKNPQIVIEWDEA